MTFVAFWRTLKHNHSTYMKQQNTSHNYNIVLLFLNDSRNWTGVIHRRYAT